MKVRYWWSEDGDSEICEKSDKVMEVDGECYHCATKLHKGDRVCELKVLNDEDSYILCKTCTEKSTQEL